MRAKLGRAEIGWAIVNFKYDKKFANLVFETTRRKAIERWEGSGNGYKINEWKDRPEGVEVVKFEIRVLDNDGSRRKKTAREIR